jgi:DNA polymerase-3 subunit beta
MAARNPKENAMKLVIERAQLQRALGAAAAVVERRATIPILSNVLIEAAGDIIRIVASDLEIQIGVKAEAKIEMPGAVTVGAQLIQSIVRELDEGAQVQLELAEGHLALTSGRSRYKLPTLPAQDFPLMQPVKGEVAFSLPAPEMATRLKSIAFAQSSEETRYYLMGVHIDVRDERLTFAATNGHLLAVAEGSAPNGSGTLERGIIMHRKLVGELIKLLDDAEGDIDLATDHQRVALKLGQIDIISKLIEGDYPDFRRFLPGDHPFTLKVRGSALAAAARRTVAINDEKTRSIRCDFAEDLIKVSVRSALNGFADEEVPCVYGGGVFAIGMQSRYVLDTLEAIGGDDIEISLNPEGHGGQPAPTLFTSPTRPDGKWVIMPMRV